MCEETYRKWVVLVAVYCTIILVASTTYMSGILYTAVLEKYNGEKAWTSLVVSLNSGLLCLLGTGNALAMVPGSVILSYYFTDHRNTILALHMTFVGLGLFVASPLAMMFLDIFALNGTFLMIGAINAHICIIGVLCKPSKVENELRLNRRKPKLDAAEEQNDVANYEGHTDNGKKCRIFRRFHVQMISFPLFLVSTFTWNAVLGIFLVHLPTYATQQDSSAAEITAMMALLSISNTGGRIIGVLVVGSQRISPLIFHGICLCSVGVIATLFPVYESKDIAKYILAGSVGFLTGPPNSMMTPNTLTLVGVKAISTATGWMFFFCGAGFLVGPPIIGAMFDQSGTYRSGFIFTGILGIAGGVVAMVIDRFLVTTNLHQDSSTKEMTVKAANEKNVSSALLKA